MEKGKKTKAPLGVVLLAISMMGILFGWVVYAQPPTSPIIDLDVANVAIMTQVAPAINQQPTTGPASTAGITSVATQFLSQQSEQVLATQNASLLADLYGISFPPSLNPPGTAVAPNQAIITRHFGDGYCMPGLEAGNCATDPLLIFGDVKFTSLVSGTAFTPPQALAASDYLSNLFITPLGPLVANVQQATPNDITMVSNTTVMKAYAQALSDETLLTIARQSFAEMIAKRTVPDATAGAQSEMQVMEAEAIKRFMSASWNQMIQTPTTTPVQLQQEALKMQAYQSWMAYQQYKQMERIEGLLAGIMIQNARSAQAIAATVSGGSSSTPDTSGSASSTPSQ